MDDYTILHGDCLEVMAAMDAGSVDAVCCDPPYALTNRVADVPACDACGRQCGGGDHVKVGDPCPRCGVPLIFRRTMTGAGFMGKDWDNGLVAFSPEVWGQALRVLKPSHYLLAFGGTRTWHRLACAIEDAGFEIRDTLMWIYGSGFPKGKASLKPAWEPVILARKPGPMRELGIESCRIHTNDKLVAGGPKVTQTGDTRTGASLGMMKDGTPSTYVASPSGRWPANLILECTCDETREGTAAGSHSVGKAAGHYPGSIFGGGHNKPFDYSGPHGKEPVRIHTDPNCPCAMLDGQTPNAGGSPGVRDKRGKAHGFVDGRESVRSDVYQHVGDSGGASRFFLNVKQECDLCDSPADSAASSSTTTPATLDTSAPTLAPNWPVEQLARDAKSAASLCDSCATAIARRVAATPPGNDPEHQAGLASISALGGRTLTHCLALYVAALASTGTTPTTASPSLWSGCVRDATRGSIPIDDAENARDLSRFRYVSKASRSERNAGCEGMEEREASERTANVGLPDLRMDHEQQRRPAANHHPTVKPLALMRWLVRLVARPGDVVLDPFMGSGTTGVACVMEGREFIGIEREAEYIEIARRRIEHAGAQGRLKV